MTINSTRDSRLTSSRRAEAARRELEAKPKPELRPTKQSGAVADGFSDTKLDEMADIAKGMSLGDKAKASGATTPSLESLKGNSGFDTTRLSKTTKSEVKTKVDVKANADAEGDVSVKASKKTEAKSTTTWVDEMDVAAVGLDAAKKETLEKSVSAKHGFKATADSVKVDGALAAGLDFKSSNGWGISASAEVSATASTKVTEKDGVTTFVVSGEVSAKANAGISAPVASLEATDGLGANASLTVSMPTDAYKELVKDPSGFNPMDPDTYPEGTSVTMDAATFRESELSASMKIGGPLSATGSSSTKSSEGTVIKIEKLEDGKVQLTQGPKEAFERTDSFGVKAGELASAAISRTDELDTKALQSAEFDLSTEEGRAAFNTALLEGSVPTSTAPGVSNPRRIDSTTYESSSAASASIKGLSDFSVDGPANVGKRTVVTNEDGTAEASTTLKYGDNPALTVGQSYDKDGTETARTYAFEVTPDETTAALYNELLTGSKEGPVKAGEKVSLTFTAEQLAALQERIGTRLSEQPAATADWVSRNADHSVGELTNDQFAAVIARSASEPELALELYRQLVTLPTVAGQPVEPLSVSVSS